MQKQFALRYLERLRSNAAASNAIVDSLRELIDASEGYEFEISKKVQGGEEHCSRVNLLYRDDFEERHRNCIACVEAINNRTGLSFLFSRDLLPEGLDIKRLDLMVIGADLRQAAGSTRVKLWFEFSVLPDQIRGILASRGFHPGVMETLVTEKVLLGYDLHPNGKVSRKVHFPYYGIRDNDRQYVRLARHFDGRTVMAMQACQRVYVSFRAGEPDIFLYFFHHDIRRVIDLLGLYSLDRSLLEYVGCSPYIFGAYYRDIAGGELAEYNLYYLPGNRGKPSPGR